MLVLLLLRQLYIWFKGQLLSLLLLRPLSIWCKVQSLKMVTVVIVVVVVVVVVVVKETVYLMQGQVVESVYVVVVTIA